MSAEQAWDCAFPHQAPTEGSRQGSDGGVVTDLLTRDAKQAVRKGIEGDDHCIESTAIVTNDGTKLATDILFPRSTKIRGAIIFVHGFAGEKGENGLFDVLASHCVDGGFAAVLYDWRGIGDSGGDFPSSTLRDHAADFANVAQWTKSRFEAEALYAVGFSLGAAVVGLALRHQVELTSAAYLSPASRPRRSMWPRYSGEALWSDLRQHGVVEKPGSSVLLGASILNSLRDTDLGPQAFDLGIPLLVCHGTGDVRIDCSHTRELARQRNGKGAFRFVEFEDASHSFRPADSSWDVLGNEITTWFGGEADPTGREHSGHSSVRRPHVVS